MAKVPFSKLGLKINTDIETISYGDYDIEIRKYLPIEEKTELISNVLNLSLDDNGFYNPLKVKVFLTLETVYFYTNLSFTAKMKEDGLKLYDILLSTGLFNKILNCIPQIEWEELQDTIKHLIENIYNYKNSVLGILDIISTDYSNLNLDINALTDKLLNDESLTTLKQLTPLVQ